MCGENKMAISTVKILAGSPPRVRGKPDISDRRKVCARITPACAGKTGTEPKLEAVTEDHPRVCGENASFLTVNDGVQGSPPRVRGKLDSWDGLGRLSRITPACAGKTKI